MTFKSPPKPRGRPARLIEDEGEDSVFEATRSSGVGQYGNREFGICYLMFKRLIVKLTAVFVRLQLLVDILRYFSA